MDAYFKCVRCNANCQVDCGYRHPRLCGEVTLGCINSSSGDVLLLYMVLQCAAVTIQFYRFEDGKLFVRGIA